MKILLVSDAWLPSDLSLVRTLVELTRELQSAGHEVEVLHPGRLQTWGGARGGGRGPAWPAIGAVSAFLRAIDPDAIHIATEGPLGWAVRRHCRRHDLAFTSHCAWSPDHWPKRLSALPRAWTQAWLRHFHAASARVLVNDGPAQHFWRQQGLAQVRCWFPGVDTRLFAPGVHGDGHNPIGLLAHPVSLYMGPVSHDQGIEEFLSLDVPGSLLVCGTGPQLDPLRQRHPNVHWLGAMPRPMLARVYAAADVLVVPGREGVPPSVLEALACGTPVAGQPGEAMLSCFGQSPAAALHPDLREAWALALRVPRHVAREHALRFSWPRAARRFVAELQPLVRPRVERTRPMNARRPVLPAVPTAVEGAAPRSIMTT